MKKEYFDHYDINVLNALYNSGTLMSKWELHKKTGHSPDKIQKVLEKLKDMDLVVSVYTGKKDRNNNYRYDWTINIGTFKKYFRIVERYHKNKIQIR